MGEAKEVKLSGIYRKKIKVRISRMNMNGKEKKSLSILNNLKID